MSTTIRISRSLCTLTIAIGLCAGGPKSPPDATEPALVKAPDAPPPAPALLLAETQARPKIQMAWEDAKGTTHRVSASLVYTSPSERRGLGEGVDGYIAMGGTRLDKQSGDPRGAIVRAGFYRAANAQTMFPGIAPDSIVTVTIEGVRFNQPVGVDPRRVVQHIKFSQEELEACGLVGEATDLFNTSDEQDPMRARIRRESARHGYFSSQADAPPPSVRVEMVDERTATVVVRFPYAALRHPSDPSRLAVQGAFQEPGHFHVEFEAVPVTNGG